MNDIYPEFRVYIIHTCLLLPYSVLFGYWLHLQWRFCCSDWLHFQKNGFLPVQCQCIRNSPMTDDQSKDANDDT